MKSSYPFSSSSLVVPGTPQNTSRNDSMKKKNDHPCETHNTIMVHRFPLRLGDTIITTWKEYLETLLWNITTLSTHRYTYLYLEALHEDDDNDTQQ
eukprot:CAMPEP_0195270108 /NCGR_PEP_ID=MMETSP0706-20130129/14150_1 /TAXON_ID=33640 /ORGANISM="Asterionellopsis glacialis, Strain CCMP134" /LENGTH=95 /DNA_ID=CAMNT_0040325309 /DNA_START=334 /DNA_END=621 /DNA_ORIENTATION=-